MYNEIDLNEIDLEESTISIDKVLSNLNLNLDRVKILSSSFNVLSNITDYVFLEDVYSYGSQKVTKYGINVYTNNLNNIVTDYNAMLESFNTKVGKNFNDTKSVSSTQSRGKKSTEPEKITTSLLHYYIKQ